MKQAIILRTVLALCLSLPALESAAATTNVTVLGTANIFSAGLAAPVAPAGGGAGTLPIQIPIVPCVTRFEFHASGAVVLGPGFGGSAPDGYSEPYAPMDITGIGGVSGYLGPGFALVGVFLPDGLPVAPAPARLDFTGNQQHPTFASLSPELGQVFFIGDGLTYGGLTTQSFIIPAGATRLFLGMPDCYSASSPPGWYGDNSGSLSVKVSQIP